MGPTFYNHIVKVKVVPHYEFLKKKKKGAAQDPLK